MKVNGYQAYFQKYERMWQNELRVHFKKLKFIKILATLYFFQQHTMLFEI